MQNDTIQICEQLLYQAESIGEGGKYTEAIAKINEAINHLVYFTPLDAQQDKKASLLHNCFFTAGRYYFELKQFEQAIENFITAKLFVSSKEDTDRLDGWIDGSFDEYEFLLREENTKKDTISELRKLKKKLAQNNIQIPARIEKLLKRYG